MTIFRKLWRTAVDEVKSSLARYADGGLALHEFTAMLGIKGDIRDLAKRLQQEDAKATSAHASGVRRLREDGKPSEKISGVRSRRPDGEGSGMLVPGVQSLRWVLFQPEVHNDDSENSRTRARFVLVLSFVFDGDVQDALEELCQEQATLDVLSFCTGFERKNAVKYLKARRVKSGFMFRDLGPLCELDGPDEPREFDATRSEIEDAFRVQERFEKFYATHPATSRDLQQAFLDEFKRDTFPFAPTPFERPLPDEPRIARRVSEVIRSGQEHTARRTREGLPRRGAHTKGHGLLRGTLRVEPDIPPHLAKGLFAAAGETFDVVARSSNGAPRRDCDRKRDERGLAISVELPLDGEGAFAPDQFLFPPEQQSRGRQDFVLNSDPEFFAANIREALTIFSILSTTPLPVLLARTGAFVIGNAAYRQSWLFLRGVFAKAVRHPLLPALYSATPYLLGDDHVVKYSAEVLHPEDLSRFKVKWDYSYLRRALRESLEQRPIEMALYVHAVSRSEWPLETIRNAVEDATTDFSTLDACKVRVATIRFEQQDSGTPERMREAERWSFSPWNALKMHRPLGSINRGRLLIYHNSAHLRAQVAAAQQRSDDSGEVPSDRSGSQAAE